MEELAENLTRAGKARESEQLEQVFPGLALRSRLWLPIRWWIGAFYPRPRPSPRPTSTQPLEQVMVEVASVRQSYHDPPVARAGWNDQAERTRLAGLFEGDGGGSSFQRSVDSSLQREDSVKKWRRRNRVMSMLSLGLLAVGVGVGIWAGLMS